MSEGPKSSAKYRDSIPKPPFVTRSASPPIFRPFELFSRDRAPPAKRPRLASTPSSSSLSRSTPASVLATDVDIDEERRASSARLLNVWAQLEERYSRPLDEDDIIDLSTGTLVKDRGVLRNLDKTYEMGVFADDDPGSDAGTLAEDDDDLDEINFLAQADLSDELDKEKEKLYGPPRPEMDPAYEEDLREFLEAERMRKEMYGDESGEEEDDIVSTSGFVQEYGYAETSRSRGKARDDRGSEACYIDEDAPDTATCSSQRDVNSPSEQEYLNYFESESEDEFAAWTIDEPPITPRHARQAVIEDIIDLTDSPLSSPHTKGSDVERSEDQERPVERLITNTPVKPRPRTYSKTPIVRKPTPGPSAFPRSPSNPVVQLATPPQSSSSVIEDNQDYALPSGPSSPTCADIVSSPFGYNKHSEDAASDGEQDPFDSQHGSESPLIARHSLARSTPKQLMVRASRPCLVPEVMFAARQRRSRSVNRDSASLFGAGHPALELEQRSTIEDDAEHSNSWRGKGKRSSSVNNSEQGVAGEKKHIRTPKTSRDTESTPPNQAISHGVHKVTSPKARKRKRVSSTPLSLSDHTPEEPIVTRTEPPKRKSRRQPRSSLTPAGTSKSIDESGRVLCLSATCAYLIMIHVFR